MTGQSKRTPRGIRRVAIVFGLILSASLWAQDDLFITVSAPGVDEDTLFTTVSVADPTPEANRKDVPAAVQKQSAPQAARLRDPFWPLGYTPADWNKKEDSSNLADEEGWKAAMTKLKAAISGTSQLGGRPAAIINGQLKVSGDIVGMDYNGKEYQWQLVESNGQLRLKKMGIK